MLIAAASYPGLTRDSDLAARAIAARIADAAVRELPFPHLLIDGLLDPSLLEGLLRDFPGDEHFEQGRQTSQGRRNLDHDSEPLRRLAECSAAWSVLAEALEAPVVRRGLVNRFAAQMRLHGCRFDPMAPTSLRFDLSRARAPYQRGCHLDRRTHLVSALLYLNDPADYAPEGGELLLYQLRRSPPRRGDVQARPSEPAPAFDTFPDPAEVEIARRVEPRGNRLVVMLNTSTSYHGVAPLRGSRDDRRFIYAAVDPAAPIGDPLWPPTEVRSEARRAAFLAQ